MGVSMATGTRMLGLQRMHASGKCRGLIGVACLALDRRDQFRMRILLDRRVTINALEAAVQARAVLPPIHTDAMARGILQAGIRVAGEAIAVRLRQALHGAGQKRQRGKNQRDWGSCLHGGSGFGRCEFSLNSHVIFASLLYGK